MKRLSDAGFRHEELSGISGASTCVQKCVKMRTNMRQDAYKYASTCVQKGIKMCTNMRQDAYKYALTCVQRRVNIRTNIL